MRRIRNKNPSFNHNSSAVYYQPHFNNVKYDDNASQKKEEVLKKVFFKESSKMDELRYNPISQAGAWIMSKPVTKNDPFSCLQMIDHCLAESMYITNLNAAAQASRQYQNLQSIMSEMELETL